jgi:hypothetical protein
MQHKGIAAIFEGQTLSTDQEAQWQKAEADFQALTKELDMIRAISEREAAANAVDPVPILAAGLEGDLQKEAGRTLVPQPD